MRNTPGSPTGQQTEFRVARITDAAIDPAALLQEVASISTGATILFVGTVRDTNDGRDVSGIDYSAYTQMAERILSDICGEAREKFGTGGIALEHRVGTLQLGDASVAIAVSHKNRGPAFDAARYIIEELKKRVPIWKREHYTDGTLEWVENAGPAKDRN